jgi:hypothetical protein
VGVKIVERIGRDLGDYGRGWKGGKMGKRRGLGGKKDMMGEDSYKDGFGKRVGEDRRRGMNVSGNWCYGDVRDVGG